MAKMIPEPDQTAISRISAADDPICKASGVRLEAETWQLETANEVRIKEGKCNRTEASL